MQLEELMQHAFAVGASDIHLSANMPPMLRINGDLEVIQGEGVLSKENAKELIYSALKEEEKINLEKNYEFDFSYVIPNLGGFRGNIYYSIEGLSAAFRLIPKVIPSLDDLDLPPIFKELLNFPNGLILVTGPTGSGKSTTMAAMVNHINQTQAKHIITIEDPIEFIHTSNRCLIHQRQLHRETHSFANALRSALREDPDIILVGEMRDLETIRLALTAAETGHLVLATLHTSSAPHAVNRIVDVFNSDEKLIIRNMLSESLRAVIAQTLAKRTAGGRVPVFEIMLGIPAIKNLIREDKVAQMYSIIQTNASKGMCTFDQYLQDLVSKNAITHEIAREIAENKESFALS